MYSGCTWYALGMYKYVLGKTKKWMRITLGFEPWISSIASCTIYRYATSVHSMVLYMVNSRYIFSKIYTGVALYLPAGVGRRSRRAPITSLVRTWLTWTWIYQMPMLAQQETDLESSSWLLNTPCQWSPLASWGRWDSLPWAVARPGPVTVHWYPGPWFIWLQLLTWVNSWASSLHGRQASGPPRSARTTWAEANLGRNTTLKFSKVQVLVRSLVGKPQSPWLKIMWVPCFVVIHSV